MSLLEIDDLRLRIDRGAELLHGISLTVEAGETLGLVGESGSGKSLTARSVLGLLPEGAHAEGAVHVDGLEVLAGPGRSLTEARRHRAAMIFQDPRAGINPMRTIGDHMTESLRLNEGWDSRRARARALELLAAVKLPRPEDHLGQFPHELSGGMLQRVMIAGALTSDPKLLVCDEPTTALDVTTQAEIVALLRELRDARGMGMLFITHDLNLAASLCDRLVVLRAGVVEEQGPARKVLLHPQTDYARRLIAATPTIAGAAPAGPGAAIPHSANPSTGARTHPFASPESMDSSLDGSTRASAAAAEGEVPAMLSVRGLAKTYTLRRKPPVVAVRDASLDVAPGGALAIVGESGSGKSTLARMIVGLEQADSGDIIVAGRERTSVPRTRAERLAHARSVQMVFQDPYLSLDPRIPVGRAIGDALRLHGRATGADVAPRVLSLLEAVGLGEQHAAARPRTLSGGQRQRVAIARALAVEPDVLVMDEATSALDVSVQAQVLDLVGRIREERALTLLFISHDLAVVRRVCEQTVVMRNGEIVERGETARLLADPQHPYTRMLVDSVPAALIR